MSLFLGVKPSASRIALCVDYSLPELFNLFAQGNRRVDRRPRRHKSTGLKIGGAAISPMKPDAERPSELQRRKSGGVVTRCFMHGAVSGLPQSMKNISGLLRYQAVI
ncbi:hypothetical protein D3C85_1084330 [compost metagenome]